MTVHRLVIRHPRRDAVFVVRDDGWHLPTVTLDERHTADVEPINAAVRHAWGFDTVVLVALDYAQDAHGVRRAHLLHATEASHLSLTDDPGGDRAWLSLEDLVSLDLSEDDVALIGAALARRDVVDGREWTRPGWWPAAREWIAAQAGDVDVVQTRVWESSCVARVHRRGNAHPALFFKALPTSGAREARVTDYLSQSSIPATPLVQAADLERRWLLMKAFAGISLDEVRDPAWWERAVATYGRLQAATIDRCDDLRALGCAERRLEDLAAAIEPLVADTRALMLGELEGLTREQADAAPRLAAALRRDCETLAAMRVPAALDHGDLWPSNILINDSAVVIIDWEDACINQPLLSLGPLIAMMREWRVDLPLERVAAAYLGAFADIGRNADLNRAFALSVPLALLDMAVRYWRVSGEMSSRHPWMRAMVPFFLRHLIDMRHQ